MMVYFSSIKLDLFENYCNPKVWSYYFTIPTKVEAPIGVDYNFPEAKIYWPDSCEYFYRGYVVYGIKHKTVNFLLFSSL